jgi:hypothetical protein
MPPLNSDDVLRAEANEIHRHDRSADSTEPPAIGATVKGKELYVALHKLNSNALCLSGGGIRSASFALGVIECLAVHPRPETKPSQADEQADDEAASFLSQFQYLSTVSGGGYIGSWLSGWIARDGYKRVWPGLVGRRHHPEAERSEIAWLRAYSNYLTPRTGLLSADTWAAVSLYVRNLILNWLVLLPALCLALFAIKVSGVGVFWLSVQTKLALVYAVGGVVLMVIALRFALLNRPSRDPLTIVTPPKSFAGGSYRPNPHDDETMSLRSGANQKTFIKRCLIPAVLAALLLSLYLLTRAAALAKLGLFATISISLVAGLGIYALSWLSAWPPGKWVHPPGEAATPGYWLRDFVSWSVAGAVYGSFIGAGVFIIARYLPWLLIANADVPHAAAVFLLALIYGVPWIITGQLIAEMIFVGLTSWQPYSDSDREWFGRSTGWFAVTALGWFAATFVVFIAGGLVWWAVKEYASTKYVGSLIGIVTGAFSTLMGKSSKTPAAGQPKTKSEILMEYAVPLGAVIFITLLVLGVSIAIDYLLFDDSIIYTPLLREGQNAERNTNLLWLAIGIAITAFVAFIAWKYVNINRFSAHSIYRNRLIRAYLGASNSQRAPNPFTGFDEDDNRRMAELWPPKTGEWRPFHVINMALNVVNAKRLAWQERKAESFTVTPLHCGTAGNGLGYRPTAEYGGCISLGTAMAISGAAASPNMGYNSSPIVTLLLALFNVRLGWWLGNPGEKGGLTHRNEGPSNAIKPFITEMFGLTTDESEYVYLSDGGHFENLALYEMIRRRCRCIVISDAGCDPDFGFEDLGNAVRKIAIDLGIYITFSKLYGLQTRSKDKTVIQGSYFAIGEIDYRTGPEHNPDPDQGVTVKTAMDAKRDTVENGYILYVKPGYHRTESAGIMAYATANAAFPHESTGDQFFSESQFESYRTLGFEILDGILRSARERFDLRQKATRAPGAPPALPTLCDLIKELARAA